jgi:PPK2 family polyphosphate:nucleotide phosphotransferase
MAKKNNLLSADTRAPKKVDKEKTKKEMLKLLADLDELQNRLYASATHSVLMVIQGMDASGKDGLIRDVLGQLNPQGVAVKSFKVPTPEEMSHDFLWRVHLATPAKGMIQVFNRSHYEDILVTRVNGWCSNELAKKRMQAINNFERLQETHNNTIILKLYLHISKEEQHQRLKERMTDPTKMWKYNEKDWAESEKWEAYMGMYEDCFAGCSDIPWNIIPADQNWYKEYLVAKLLVEKLQQLDLQYPTLKRT